MSDKSSQCAEAEVEVDAEVIEDKGLSVSLVPARIEANFAALDARVEKMIAGYADARYDLSEAENVRQAKRDRTYLNGIAKEIDERRKAVKREYMRPLDDFEAGANAIVAKVRAASANIKGQLDEAEERRKDRAYATLKGYYEEFAGLLAPVVPYERIHDERWLNKTFGEMKAKAAIEEKVSGIARDWDALKAQGGMDRYETAEREFFATLDLGAALAAAHEAQAADERIAGLREAVDGRGAETETVGEPEPEPEPAPAPTPSPAPPAPPAPAPPAPLAPVPGEERKPWVVIIEAATATDMKGLAMILGQCEVEGVIKQGTLEQVYGRVMGNVR